MENVKQLFQQNIPVVPRSIMIDASSTHTLLEKDLKFMVRFPWIRGPLCTIPEEYDCRSHIIRSWATRN